MARRAIGMGTIAIAFVATAAVTAILTSQLRGGVPWERPGPAHPERNPVGAYAIEVSAGNDPFEPLLIDADGIACERLLSERDTYRTCLLATNLIPSIIGGEAHGELNRHPTRAFHALVWRARASRDPTVCERGGLEASLLDLCHAHAVDPAYLYIGGALRVKVPLNGAAAGRGTEPLSPWGFGTDFE